MSGLRQEIDQLRHEAPGPPPDPALWDEARKAEWLAQAPRAFAAQRALMVAALSQRLARLGDALPVAGVAAALAAMAKVAREAFVCPWIEDLAYLPMAIDIGLEQTISHPEMVAIAVAAAAPAGGRVLDVGTGSGYQAAVLAQMAAQVTSIEILAPHAAKARQRLTALGYRNITLLCGDAGALEAGGLDGSGVGGSGLAAQPAAPPEGGRFDAIVLAAKAQQPPANLLALLAPGGRLVMPVDTPGQPQQLTCFTRQSDGSLAARALCATSYVPLTGICQDAAPAPSPAMPPAMPPSMPTYT